MTWGFPAWYLTSPEWKGHAFKGEQTTNRTYKIKMNSEAALGHSFLYYSLISKHFYFLKEMGSWTPNALVWCSVLSWNFNPISTWQILMLTISVFVMLHRRFNSLRSFHHITKIAPLCLWVIIYSVSPVGHWRNHLSYRQSCSRGWPPGSSEGWRHGSVAQLLTHLAPMWASAPKRGKIKRPYLSLRCSATLIFSIEAIANSVFHV